MEQNWRQSVISLTLQECVGKALQTARQSHDFDVVEERRLRRQPASVDVGGISGHSGGEARMSRKGGRDEGCPGLGRVWQLPFFQLPRGV